MKTSLHSGSLSQPGFALISVLALVSLAALTATAFLASARLERSATRPIGETTRLQMALNTGRECAAEVINRVGEPHWNFVTTYWRTNLADELGYPLVGKPYGTNSLSWYYYCLFTPATWTNLVGTDMNLKIRATNTICQATFSNDIANFMVGATAGFTANPPANSKICTEIPMVGGRTSRPVGWVYIQQNIRTNPSATNTTNVPVARFAYFVEDLQGLIDAERMGASTARPSGTNSEEISITQATGTSGGTIVSAAKLTAFTNSRGQYITPSMLLQTNGGVIANTNDLRYFATRLRSCYWRTTDNIWDRIPMVPISSNLINNSYYPASANKNKNVLDNLNIGGQSDIVATITNNFPMFTNRAGGMNGKVYVNALAANVVDYADNISSGTSTNISGVSIVGFDNYPMLTHVFDQFLYSQSAKTITITTYLQFWNPSSIPTPALTGGTFTYRLNDTIRYPTNTAGNMFTNRPLTSAALANSSFTFGLLPFSFSTNSGFITSITNTIFLNTLPNFPTTAPTTLQLNTQGATGNGTQFTATNSYTLVLSSTTNIPAMSMNRYNHTLTSGTATNVGWILGFRIAGVVGNPPWRTADPRMTTYLGAGSGSKYEPCDYETTYFKGYPAQDLSVPLYANPINWPDGSNSPNATLPTRGVTNPSPFPTGAFTNKNILGVTDPAPCKLSTNGSYTNICELGNIFDPMQWRPDGPIANATNYVNTNITTAWTADSLYGGGSTLRIGRPEHSRFAFTNLTAVANSYPVPALGTSAVGLLDLFCVTNTYDWGGKININTAPLPVLAALAGGITLNTANYSGGTAPANADMIRAFTNGVAKFRNTYPFITPSQLAFISSDYGTNSTFTNSWPTNAVFATNIPTGFPRGGLAGPNAINDQGREEWFSKIYNLTTVQSFNYRIYVKAQLTDTNGDPKGPEIRKYYQLYLRNNSPAATSPDTPSVSPVVTYEAFY